MCVRGTGSVTLCPCVLRERKLCLHPYGDRLNEQICHLNFLRNFLAVVRVGAIIFILQWECEVQETAQDYTPCLEKPLYEFSAGFHMCSHQ